MINQDKIVGVKVVKEIVGVSQSTIYRLERGGKFPKRIKIPGSSRTGWSLKSVNQYLEAIKEESLQDHLGFSRTWRAGRGRVNE